jgi:Holliday junction DNA helicase RuvB
VEAPRRSRGTPRLANARLRWVRDFATARADGQINLTIATDALAMQDIDVDGMDRQDRRYLETLIQVFRGGPTGSEALAATMTIDVDTIKDEVEPYLLRKQLVILTPRGRKATHLAYKHLGLAVPEPEPEINLFDQRRLFD